MIQIDWLCIKDSQLKEVLQHLSDEEFAQEYDSFMRSYKLASTFFTTNSLTSGYLDYLHDVLSEEVGKRFLYLHELA